MFDNLAFLVMSCDKYSDLWLDFFKLRDLYWKDCDFKWYLITESKSFKYPGVTVINTGFELNWTGRLKYAINKAQCKLVGLFLEDYFIAGKVDNHLIHSLADKMLSENIMYLLSASFPSLIKMKNKLYYDQHLFHIPKHHKYGLSVSSSIWNSQYLLDLIGHDDKNPWQFEIDLCNIAASKDGYEGTVLCDERMPLQVTTIPVVIQGKFYPDSINNSSLKIYS